MLHSNKTKLFIYWWNFASKYISPFLVVFLKNRTTIKYPDNGKYDEFVLRDIYEENHFNSFVID